MAREFFPNLREDRIVSRLDSSKDHSRDRTIQQIRSNIDELGNRLAQKLLDSGNVVTTNRPELVNQLCACLRKLVSSEDFDINYQIAPFRNLVPSPNFASLFMTAFIVETLINHPSIEDIYGTDEEIYLEVDSILGRQGFSG